jgi:hypothetical protein
MSRASLAQSGTVCLLAGLFAIAHAAPLASQGAPQEDSANPAYRRLNEEIVRYLAIHTDLRAEVPGPIPDSTALELNEASDTLYFAIRRARPGGRQGDFFDADATRLIRQRLRDALRAPTVAAALAAIDDEKPPVVDPNIYLRYPTEHEMATMPASLLRVLPRLPVELEYRIVGEHLVLRDVKAAMIVDYIAGALPRK